MRAALLLAAGCAVDPGAGRAYLVLRGDVDPAVVVEGDDAALFAVWVTSVDGELCLEPDVLDLVPQVTGFEVVVEGPPSASGGDPCEPAPSEIGAGPTAWGLLALVDRAPGVVDPVVTADPERLLDWFATAASELVDLVQVDGGTLAAVVAADILVVHAGTGAFGPSYCRFDSVLPGLVLYRDRGVDCGGWEPIASAGERDEVQGVDLVPP